MYWFVGRFVAELGAPLVHRKAAKTRAPDADDEDEIFDEMPF